MKIFLPLLFFLSFVYIPKVYGEYRVFVLEISKPNPDKSQPPIKRTVQSNLDPVQYRDYYPLTPDEQIDYVDTWMCTGRTSEFLDYCPAPSQKAQIPEPNVSNQNGP